MPLTIRPYEERDADDFWYTRDVTFRGTNPTEPENRVFKTTRPFVADLDGKVVGVFSVLDLTCTREPGTQLKCAGIAGVAVAPGFRHLGVGSEMMRWSIPFLKGEGYQVASLYAFRESFYRKFGYEVCGQRFELEAPSPRLPKLQPELPVRTLQWTDHESIQACHETFASRYSGMNIRTPKHWSRVLDDKKTVLAVGDPVEAYAIVEHNADFWVPQWVNETAWTSWDAYRSLLAVLSQLCINKSSLKWTEPSDSPFLQLYADQGVVATDYRRIMFRILDVPGSLQALSPVAGGAFSIQVTDDLIPENRGPWRVESDGSSVQCNRVESADMKGSIQAWNQAYFGDPGIERGPIEELESGSLARAAAFLPRSIVYCQEFF